MKDLHSHPQREAWRLFIRTHARLVQSIDRTLAAAGVVSLEWFGVLQALARAPGQKLRMSDVAEALVINRSSLTRLTDRLEAAGYVRREPAPGDRRGAFAALTEEGAAALQAAEPVHTEAVQSMFGAHLDPDTAAALVTALQRIDAALPRQEGTGARNHTGNNGQADDE